MNSVNISDTVRDVISNLVPSCVLNEIACFVFYDNHPVQNKICDITVCTKYGEVKEYYEREEVLSLFLGSDFKFSQMRILRNSHGQLFYMLASENEVIILSRTDALKVHQKVTNVDHFDIDDAACRGQASLKIVLKDDAVPLIFDDNFENLGEKPVALRGMYADDSLPILTQLKSKLTQAKYSIQCNEKTQRELRELRKLTAFAAQQKLHPNLDESVINEGSSEACDELKLKTQAPSVAVCNKKVVITLTAVNNSKMSLHAIAVLLHTNKPSISYTTHLFQQATTSPFWKEVHDLQPNTETAILTVVDITEFQYNTTTRLEFNGAISYKKEEKELLVPFDSVVMSYTEFMGKRFDVLANEIDGDSILPVLATTNKLDMTLRIIDRGAPGMTLSDMFCYYMEMEHVIGVNNAVIHKKSPHHVLNGVMVIFEDENASKTSIAVYVRSLSQVLPMLHYIHEAIPNRIIVTSQNHKITEIVDSLSRHNEVPETLSMKLDYSGYAPSMLRQTAAILEYLDSCIVKMNENKDAKAQSKIGKEIDLLAGGLSLYAEFRSNFLIEAETGVQCLKQCEVKPVVDSGSMLLDNE